MRWQEDGYAREHGYRRGALISTHPLGTHELRVGDWSSVLHAQMLARAASEAEDEQEAAAAPHREEEVPPRPHDSHHGPSRAGHAWRAERRAEECAGYTTL